MEKYYIVNQWNADLIDKERRRIYILAGEGIDFIDPFFYKNYEEICKLQKNRNNVKYGFAYIITARSKAEAEQEAYSFYKLICDLKYDLPSIVIMDNSEHIENTEILKREFISYFNLMQRKGNIYRRKGYKAEYIDYIVKAKDDIVKIANMYYVLVGDILRVNKKLNPEKLQVGKSIRIPVDSSRSCYDKFNIVEINQGKSLIEMCRDYKISYKELCKINYIPEKYKIKEGQLLKFPRAM